MLEIVIDEAGVVHLSGRLDASQADKADEILSALKGSTTADFSRLEYISSAGIGIILKTYRRLHESGETLRLTNMNKRIRTIFLYAGLDRILTIE